MLVRVHTCGICGTDLKKIATGSHSAPRIFGHETSGVIVATGEGVTRISGRRAGDGVPSHPVPRLLLLPATRCSRSARRTRRSVHRWLRTQRRGLRRIRAGDGLDRRRSGVVRIPDGVSFEQASFIEPVNTCMKGIETLRLVPGETVLVIGQGPIGMILACWPDGVVRGL